MELNVSRTKPKRERGHNWSTKEKIILFECVKDYLHIVSDCRNAVEVRKKKNLTWAWIAKLSKEMGVYVNETLKIKTQWKRMRITAKKNIHAYQNGLAVDGKMVVPSELDWNVYNAITSVNNKRRSKPSGENELSIAGEIKHEIPVEYAFDNTTTTVQIPDDVYSIEDDSESSHSNISLGSQTSTDEPTNHESANVYHETEDVLQQSSETLRIAAKKNINAYHQNDLVVDDKLDWSIYNAVTNACGEKRQKSSDIVGQPLSNEIKPELPDDYAEFNNISTTIQIPDEIDSNKMVSISPQTKTIELNNSQGGKSQPPNNAITDHQDKLLAVQLKIEEAKLKEIEERIHQQRVIFELNKTLLQKQIENESVKKYM